jgi:hypothetical protein
MREGKKKKRGRRQERTDLCHLDAAVEEVCHFADGEGGRAALLGQDLTDVGAGVLGQEGGKKPGEKRAENERDADEEARARERRSAPWRTA